MKPVIQESELFQGCPVFFDTGDGQLQGTGTICGIASRVPGITVYIVHPDEPLTFKDYPYTHFTVPHVCLKTFDPEELKAQWKEKAQAILDRFGGAD